MGTDYNNQDFERTAPARPGILRILRRNIVAVVIVLALIAGYFLLRTSPSDVATMEELQALTSGGQPVLVEFYSNF